MHETVESTAVVDGSLDRVQHRDPGRTISACRRAGSTSACTTPCSAWRRGCTTTSATPCWPSSRANKLNTRHHLRRPQSEDRHHHHRQELSRRAPGARRTRHRRGEVQRLRPAHLQDRLPLAARAARLMEFAKGLDLHHRRRGEALADRGAGPRGALRHRQPAGLHRQEGRAGRLAVPGQGRARSERGRDLHRRAAAALRPRRRDSRAASRG